MDDSADPGRARDTGSAASDEEAGFDVRDDFRRFSQRDDIFCRSFWDPEVRTHRSDMFYETYRTPKLTWRSVDGFTQRDYALRNASWHVTDIFAELRGDDDRREGFLDPYTAVRDGPGSTLPVASPEEAAREIKHAAKTWAPIWWGSPGTTSGGSTRTRTAAKTSTRSRRRSPPTSET